MKELIVACSTVKRELEYVLEKENKSFEIIWVESGLHNTPSLLSARISQIFREIDEKGYHDRILMCFGTCGNYLNGIVNGNFETVVPRVDDCISLLLGSVKRRQEISREEGTYFLTKGWIEGERNIWVEYRYSVEKYGQEEADELFDMMMSGYGRIGLLDTEAYNIDELVSECAHIASDLKLNLEKIKAGLDYIKKLINGPYDKKEFIIIEKNQTINLYDLELFI